MSPMTPRTRATISSGRWRLLSATAIVHAPSMNTQSSIEPSCEPHAAAIRYSSGSRELELVATFNTEKSFATNEYARQPKANAMNRNCPVRERSRERHPHPVAALRAGERQRAEERRQEQRENQGEMAELGNHRRILRVMASASWRPCPSPRAIVPDRRRQPPRAACSSRRASPALQWPGTRRPGRSCPAPRRPCPP